MSSDDSSDNQLTTTLTPAQSEPAVTPSHPSEVAPRGSLRGRSSLARRPAVCLLVGAGVVGSIMFAVPSATAAPKPTITQVQKNVSNLQRQAEQASEDYNQAQVQLKSIDVRLKAAQADLAAQKQQVALAKAEVGRLAAETYREGQLSTLDVVLGGDDPDTILAQTGYLPSLGERQVGATNRLKAGEAELADTETTIAAQQTKAEATKARIQLEKKQVNKKLAEAKAQLDTLKAAQRRALAAAQTRTEDVNVPSAVLGKGGTAYCDGMAVKAPTGAAKAAIKFACAQLGKPYVWAASGPNSYDCSGLTMRAYQAGGISLPHSSIMQATYGHRVSTGALEPGDLLFFFSPISHVAIYLGNGLMIHAPHTGDVVRIASVFTTPTAAVRFG